MNRQNLRYKRLTHKAFDVISHLFHFLATFLFSLPIATRKHKISEKFNLMEILICRLRFYL